MSDSDSFFDEVTEEVRRDQLYAYLRKYGWIAALVILGIVGGAAWNEYRKSQDRAAAETMGDALITALAQNDAAGRAEALMSVEPTTPGNAAVRQMMVSAAQARTGEEAAAVAGLEAIAADADLPQIYRQIAAFKSLLIQADTLDTDTRRQGFVALATPGQPLRLLAEEQIALIDIQSGDTEAALSALQSILEDAEANAALKERVSQLIVALGGTPEPVAQSQG